MRLWLMAGVAVAFSSLPYLIRRGMATWISPRQLVMVSALTLVGLASSLLGILGILVAPEAVRAIDMPRAVELCVDAVGQLFRHPLGHWLSIAAALALLAALTRLGIGLMRTLRDSRRARLPRADLPGESDARVRYFGTPTARVRILPTADVAAYTTGVLRPQVVVTAGLLGELDEEERAAVLAHEAAHTRGPHMAIFVAARVIRRAFGFLPPVRISMSCLRAALEASADDEAVQRVGDRFVVARTLASVAALSSRKEGVRGLGVADAELAFRLRRLGASPLPVTKRRFAGAMVVVLATAAMISVGIAWSASQAAAGEARAQELHRICHLPHEPQGRRSGSSVRSDSSQQGLLSRQDHDSSEPEQASHRVARYEILDPR